MPNAFANYGNIVSNMLNNGFTRYWDAAASVPYLYSEQKREFVSYEDTESLALKCAYVRRKGLGGVMFWEYTGDPTGALLSTINTAFYGNGAGCREQPMNATVSAPAIGIAGQAISTRVVSIDIFRGITMAVMIFVNDLDSVHGLSKWTYHMPANVDAMTYVDMVFPAFLFIVGMALPIAVKQRLKRNASVASLWMHVVLRSIALLVLGLILANAEQGDPARMHISPNAWALLGLAGGILLWNVYSGLSSRTVLLLRGTGAALIVAHVRHLSPFHSARRSMDQLFLSGDTRPHRPDLLCHLPALHPHPPLALHARSSGSWRSSPSMRAASPDGCRLSTFRCTSGPSATERCPRW